MTDFQVGLLDCFSDFTVCLMGWIVPCYLMALNVARVDGRDCAIWDCCCQANPNWIVRNRIRAKYGYEYDYCMDCLVSWVLGCCAAIQHHGEMNAKDGK